MELIPVLVGLVHLGSSDWFSAANGSEVNQDCQTGLDRLWNGTAFGQSTYVQVLDSWGKVGSGIENGNTRWWGDFSECQDIATQLNYSYSVLDVSIRAQETVANFSIGLCLPRACSNVDMPMLWHKFTKFSGEFGLSPDFELVALDLRSIQSPKFQFDLRNILAIIFLSLNLGVVIIGSIWDRYPSSLTFERLQEEGLENIPAVKDESQNDEDAIIHEPPIMMEITNELMPPTNSVPDRNSDGSWTSDSMAWDRRFDFTPNQNEPSENTSESLIDTRAMIDTGVQTSNPSLPFDEPNKEDLPLVEEAAAINLEIHAADEEFQELNNAVLNRPAAGADPMIFYSITSEAPAFLAEDGSSGDNSEEDGVLREIQVQGKMRKHVKKIKMRKKRMKEYLQNRKYLKDQVLDVPGMDQVDARSPDRPRWTEPHGLTREELELIYAHGSHERHSIGPICSQPNCLTSPDMLANQSMRGFVTCFSITRNWKALVDTSSDSNSITWFHGLRVFSVIWLGFGQSMIYILPMVSNPTQVLDVSASFLFQVLPGSLFAVDSFLFISGFLFSYVHQTKMKVFCPQDSWTTWVHFYCRRLLSIIPGYLALILIISPLSRYFGTGGPFWPQECGNCTHLWWRDLTLLQNMWPIEEACVEWGWFVALYAQIVIVVPIFLWFLDTIPILSMIQIFSGLVVSIGYSAYSIAQFDPHSIIPSPENPAIFREIFNAWYTVPWTRIQPTLVGMFFGYLYHCLKIQLRQNSDQIRVLTRGWFSWLFWFGGWFLSTSTLLSLIFGLWNSDYNEDVYHLYWAFCRPIWALALAWMTFATSFLTRTTLSCPGLIPLSKLTYSVYLLFPVIMTTVYRNLKVPLHFDGLTFLVYTIGIMAITYMFAVLFHLLFVSPLHGVKKVFLR